MGDLTMARNRFLPIDRLRQLELTRVSSAATPEVAS